MHEIRADGSRGKRLGVPDGCPGYQSGRTEERPPEDELRRRLDAVLALHQPHPTGVPRPWCTECVGRTHPCPTVRAARGEAS
jgi:hypothetical protein